MNGCNMSKYTDNINRIRRFGEREIFVHNSACNESVLSTMVMENCEGRFFMYYNFVKIFIGTLRDG